MCLTCVPRTARTKGGRPHTQILPQPDFVIPSRAQVAGKMRGAFTKLDRMLDKLESDLKGIEANPASAKTYVPSTQSCA